MKKMIFLICFLCLLSYVVADTIISFRQNIDDSLTTEEKNKIKEKYDVSEYKVIEDWTSGNEYCFRYQPLNKIKCISDYQNKLTVWKTVGNPGINATGVHKEIDYVMSLEELREREITKSLRKNVQEIQKTPGEDAGYTKEWTDKK